MCKIEEELSSLEGEDKQEMLEALGLTESGLDKVVKTSYELLGLMSFLTAGEPEVRAWTIKKRNKSAWGCWKNSLRHRKRLYKSRSSII